MVKNLETFELGARRLFAITTFMSVLIMALAATNLSFARAIIGFVYLTFVPGLVIVKLLRADKLGSLETILLSVGLSVAFLMFFGLVINFLYPAAGISDPLSLMPLLPSIVLATEAMATLLLLRDIRRPTGGNGLILSKKGAATILLAVPFMLLPILSVIGTLQVNVSNNNTVLLSTIFFVSFLVAAVAFSKKLKNDAFLVFALLMVALALLFQSSLISNYVYGGDMHMEFQLFRITQLSSYWSPTIGTTDLGYNWLNAMLSITILPTVYSNILAIDGTWVFKIVTPIIFSFVCLGLYLLYKKEFDAKIAFVSVFFFIANSVFFVDATFNVRDMIAELFYVLLFFVLLDSRLNRTVKSSLFIIFGAALIVSHYATAYVFLFIIVGLWLLMYFFKKSATNMVGLIITFSAVMFSWYIYVSNAGPFRGLLSTLDFLWGSFFNQFLVPQARGTTVLTAVGIGGVSTFWHVVGRGFFYITEILIVIGFLVLILKRKSKVVSTEYLAISAMNMIILLGCLVIPSFANTLNVDRFYHLTLFFLAPLLVIGGLSVLRLVRRNLRTETAVFLIVLFLVPFFLFQTGFVYQIAGEVNYSLPLNENGMGSMPYVQYSIIRDYDVFGAEWLSSFVNSGTAIYAETDSDGALISTALIFGNTVRALTNATVVEENSVVFLSSVNVIEGTVDSWNTSQISYVFDGLSLVYSNGGCNIYKR
jgi:uncharacterized membrane protein